MTVKTKIVEQEELSCKELPSALRKKANRYCASRDNWKQRVSVKRKQLQTLMVKNSDLEKSRDAWKEKHKKKQSELRKLEKELELEKKKTQEKELELDRIKKKL